MKKLLLIGLGLLLSCYIVYSQDTTKSQIDTNYIEVQNNANVKTEKAIINLQINLKNIEDNIIVKQSEIKILEDSIKNIKILITNGGDEKNLDRKIDQFETKIEINEEIIEALEDATEEIEDAIKEINDEMDEIAKEITENTNKIGKSKANKKKKFKGHYAGLQLGLNTYVTKDYSFGLPSESNFLNTQLNKSWEYSVNPVQFSIPFFNRYVGAVTGIGFTFNNYELLQNVDLFVTDQNVLDYSVANVVYTKNRFKTTSLNVPFIIEIQIPTSKKDKRIHIGAGMIGSLNLDARYKTEYLTNNTEVKFNDKTSLWPVNVFNYQATARIGYDDWYIFANYSFKPLFETGKAPEVYPISAGLAFRFN